jgi:hypothetical protein
MSGTEFTMKIVGKLLGSAAVTCIFLLTLKLVTDLHKWLFPEHDNKTAMFIDESKQWAYKAFFLVYLLGEVYFNLWGESSGLPDL